MKARLAAERRALKRRAYLRGTITRAANIKRNAPDSPEAKFKRKLFRAQKAAAKAKERLEL
jgi:hypothetical protein